MLKLGIVLKIAGKIIYLSLLAVGCYFIYEGEVLKKFALQKRGSPFCCVNVQQQTRSFHLHQLCDILYTPK